MQDMTPYEIEQFLDDTRIGRLCMAGADGRPYTIPMPFCWLAGALYVRLPLTGRKGRVLRENDRVCFEADDFTDALDDYTSVIVEGRLVEVTDLDEKRRAKLANDAKYRRLRGGHRPGHGRTKPLEELPLRKVVVEHVGGRTKGREPVAPAPVIAGTDGVTQPW
jgi:nitroimidazol reductase NimA-like FMN-containing flavoprotein (pyridoxamine 5'-phosphate oxidase superfamily)